MIENILFGVGFAILLGVAGRFDFEPTCGMMPMLIYYLAGIAFMLPKAFWLRGKILEAQESEEDDI